MLGFFLFNCNMHYTYILYSEHLNKFYIGSSHNPDERLIKHLENHQGFTANAKDWKIVYTQAFNSKTEAIKREFQIKKWKSRKMIEKLIND